MIGRVVWACERRCMRREVNDHPKALFRRATANAALLNYEAAMEDFKLCKDVSPALAKDVDRWVSCLFHVIVIALSKFSSTMMHKVKRNGVTEHSLNFDHVFGSNDASAHHEASQCVTLAGR